MKDDGGTEARLGTGSRHQLGGFAVSMVAWPRLPRTPSQASGTRPPGPVRAAGMDVAGSKGSEAGAKSSPDLLPGLLG